MLSYLDEPPISGRLVYCRPEHSFDVEPRPGGGVTSLLVNDVQLEMDEDGRLLNVWGYCPQESWKPASLAVPAAKSGRLQYVGDDVVPGVSIRLHGGRWPVRHDLFSRWLCIDDEAARGDDRVRARRDRSPARGRAVALWLRPEP